MGRAFSSSQAVGKGHPDRQSDVDSANAETVIVYGISIRVAEAATKHVQLCKVGDRRTFGEEPSGKDCRKLLRKALVPFFDSLES